MFRILNIPASQICGFWCLSLVIGCGGSQSFSTDNSRVEPPHGGTLVILPDGKFFIEIVKKEGVAPITSELSFYFYKDAAYTPIDPLPESGELFLDPKRKVTLQIDDDALVTPPGPILFANKEVEGVLNIELDGEPTRISLGVR